MTGWVCQWKPFWIPVDDSFKKAYVEEWVFQVTGTSDLSLSGGHGDVVPETLKVWMLVPSSPWGPPKYEESSCSRERIEAPLPPLQPRPTRERLELPFSCDSILSGYQDLVSSGSDQFTMWGKMSHREILAEHAVDIHTAVADFRDAFERIQSSSSQSNGVNKYFSSQIPLQKRLSIYNWNPRPRRGKEDAIEKRIAGKWHFIALQEASEYVEHETLHERFHVTHFAAVQFSSTRTPSTLTSASNRSTFTTRGEECKIILLKENMDGLARCSFTCLISSSRSQWSEVLYCIVPAYQQQLRHENGIAKKIIQTIRALLISQNNHLVAGDFSGTAWRCRSRDTPELSIKYFLAVLCLRRWAPHTFVGHLDPSQTIGRTSVVFLSTLALNDFGQ